MIPIEQFGRDHWSLLAYVEHLCVNAGGVADIGDYSARSRMRCNDDRHPMRSHIPLSVNGIRWKPDYGTRLRDASQLPDHDDWDCLEDLDDAGLVSLIGSMGVRMTDAGLTAAAEIRAFKAGGGTFSTFVPSPATLLLAVNTNRESS